MDVPRRFELPRHLANSQDCLIPRYLIALASSSLGEERPNVEFMSNLCLREANTETGRGVIDLTRTVHGERGKVPKFRPRLMKAVSENCRKEAIGCLWAFIRR